MPEEFLKPGRPKISMSGAHTRSIIELFRTHNQDGYILIVGLVYTIINIIEIECVLYTSTTLLL